MIIRYLKGKYIGENRNATQILQDVSSYIDESNATHIKTILSQGCPSKISFEELSATKSSIVCRGDQATFKMHPEIVTKTMSKEDRHSHLLPLQLWISFFSLVLSHSPKHFD
jgi:hypothetical protein